MKRAFVIIFLACTAFLHDAMGQQYQLQADLSLKYVISTPPPGAAHPGIIILLHGYGSNAQDMMRLQAALPQDKIVTCVNAPFPIGGDGYQWFEREIVKGKYSGRQQDLAHSRKLISAFIDEVVKKYHADPKQVWLAGFSQGAMMSLEVGLTAPGKLRGIGVLSGRLPESLKPLVKKGAALNALKIFISHGTGDTRLPYEDGKAANDYLVSIGLKPEFHSYEGMDHTISPEEMKDLVAWMKQ